MNEPDTHNVIINGNFEFWPVGRVFDPINHQQQGPIPWTTSLGGTSPGHCKWERDTNTPTVAEAGVHVEYSLKSTVIKANPSPDDFDRWSIMYEMEGHDFATIGHRDGTFEFWVYSSKAGTFSVALIDGGWPDRQTFVFDATITTPNTWQRVQKQIPAHPVDGTWDYHRWRAMLVLISLQAGSAYHTTPDQWHKPGGLKIATAKQSNLMDEAGAVFHITMVDMKAGVSFRPYRRYLGSWATDWVLGVQRLFQKSYDRDIEPGRIHNGNRVSVHTRDGDTFHHIRFRNSMRDYVRMTAYNPVTGEPGTWHDTTDNVVRAVTFEDAAREGATAVIHNGVDGNIVVGHWTADATL